jgi:DNA-binding PadR family transcriptional regulator
MAIQPENPVESPVDGAVGPPEADLREAGAGLNPTGRAILGMLALGKRTGYDIKQLVDKATRHFWAASYGQIYPELRRLEQQGLIRGRPEPTGGRPRTVYELTDTGAEALRTWLIADDEPLYEVRDEGMLKLFFSDALPDQQAQIVREIRGRMEKKLEQLQAIGTPLKTGPGLTLSLGIEVTKVYIEWCEAAERRLAEEG